MAKQQNFSRTFLILLTIGVIFIALISFVMATPKTFTVQETDLVKMNPSATDPDGDDVVYYFSAPLDKNGEWQTGYDDAGEYDIEIIASDGVDRSVEKVKLIVENRNLPPIVTEKKFTLKEMQTFSMKEFIEDPDQDALEYTFSTPLDSNGIWQPGYDDSGSLVVEIVVSDGEFDVEERIEIEVLNTNQPPKILESFSEETVYNIEEDEDLDFHVDSEDADQDPLTYKWIFDNSLIIGETSSGSYYLDFETKGQHTLTLIISDGLSKTTKEWTIDVENTNRRPELALIPLTINEGEKLVLDLPDLDLDGDVLSYSFEAPLDENGEWTPDFYSAGTYKYDVSASDGQLTNTETLKVTVLDVDQAPFLEVPDKLEVSEEGKLEYLIESYDPDGDEIKMGIAGLDELENVEIDFNNKEGILEFAPSYDFIKRKGGLISNILNSLRLEHYFLGKRTLPLNVTSCGKEKCSSKLTKLVVYNVNRAPELDNLVDQTITETELAQFVATATDDDGDIIHYTYDGPLHKKNGDWQTDFESEGEYPITVIASDGDLVDTKTVTLKVEKANRAPKMVIESEEYVVNEGEQVSFWVTGEDPDQDELKIRLDNLPLGASFTDGQFVWTPDYDQVRNRSESLWNNLVSSFSFSNRKYNSEQKVIWLSFVVTDESFEIVHPVKLVVKNVNRKPDILDYTPIHTVDSTKIIAPLNEAVSFQAIAQDLDSDNLEYTWDFGLLNEGVKGTDTITRTFLVPGKKTVKVTIDDGRDTITKSWEVEVVAEEVEEKFEWTDYELELDAPTEEFIVTTYVVE